MERFKLVVAGHIDGNESVMKAMQRESLEEAGIYIKEQDLYIVHVMHRKAEEREYIDYFLTCDSYTGDIQIVEKINPYTPSKIRTILEQEELKEIANQMAILIKIFKRVS